MILSFLSFPFTRSSRLCSFLHACFHGKVCFHGKQSGWIQDAVAKAKAHLTTWYVTIRSGRLLGIALQPADRSMLAVGHIQGSASPAVPRCYSRHTNRYHKRDNCTAPLKHCTKSVLSHENFDHNAYSCAAGGAQQISCKQSSSAKGHNALLAVCMIIC